LPQPEAASAFELDARDPLAHFAAEFHHPVDAGGRKAVYLCGHSLGLQPKSAASYVSEDLAEWQRLGVLGHHQGTRPWIGYHEHAARGLAALTGASEIEVVAMNSLTINLHLMMVSFFRPAGPRNCILIEKSAFPSDRYAVLSQLGFHGLDARHLIEVAPRPGEHALRTEDIIEILERDGPRLALVLWPGVQYLSGQLFDLGAITAAARAAGAAVGLDLAHAIGNVPLKLHDWDADFAVWCSYKYLNAGPGAIGGCFVLAGEQSAGAVRRTAPRIARAVRARGPCAAAREIRAAHGLHAALDPESSGSCGRDHHAARRGAARQPAERAARPLLAGRAALPRAPHGGGRDRRLAGAGHAALCPHCAL
jgi:kynureninase